MKKFCIAILAILYLSSSVGATIHLHYCMGKLVNWGLGDKTSSKCSNCGMERKPGSSANGCCRDECKQIKVDKDHQGSGNFAQLNETTTEIVLTDLSDYSIPSHFSLPGQKINSPPLGGNSSLNIIHCVFRI